MHLSLGLLHLEVPVARPNRELLRDLYCQTTPDWAKMCKSRLVQNEIIFFTGKMPVADSVNLGLAWLVPT